MGLPPHQANDRVMSTITHPPASVFLSAANKLAAARSAAVKEGATSTHTHRFHCPGLQRPPQHIPAQTHSVQTKAQQLRDSLCCVDTMIEMCGRFAGLRLLVQECVCIMCIGRILCMGLERRSKYFTTKDPAPTVAIYIHHHGQGRIIVTVSPYPRPCARRTFIPTLRSIAHSQPSSPRITQSSRHIQPSLLLLLLLTPPPKRRKEPLLLHLLGRSIPLLNPSTDHRRRRFTARRRARRPQEIC